MEGLDFKMYWADIFCIFKEHPRLSLSSFQPVGKFREEFKAAFSCRCYGRQETEGKQRVRTRTSTESRKSLSTQMSNLDSVSRIYDHVL